ncbi:zinc finger and BTB domain-containing protein 24-like [Cylas formicarius]|uniref:zinc finger and BTB domain-containing protein 24-like n=1 Tax=Cylas formicarius TaxID=197179 RepID=UPI002958B740|nr:zinc finger and BTB domain-containing protein 24-like [Cylas formicarius]XP_060521977.1 zinc finger and BTB domain-containing protein 24-like [Cylas formicarius]XP_060521978.1 zinc finger and BTB domain-containing protein 24-like [Cylas formicarius]
MKTPSTKSVRLFSDRHIENLENIFRKLFKEQLLTDVTIHCRDGSVKAHKVVLAASSAYFRRVFTAHTEPQVAYVMHGVTCGLMASLVELIYRGSTEIANDTMGNFYDLVDDLEVKGVSCDEKSPTGRDTRFKGLKRVAVNFGEEDENVQSAKLFAAATAAEKSVRKFVDNETSTSSPESAALSPTETPSTPLSPESAKRTAWALKQRKYKCELCPSSFKRASHLTRHQLVHTGERPYPCTLCDKAFSRPDKLKQHVRKAHEMIDPYPDDLVSDSLYTIGHVKLFASSGDHEEEERPITREDCPPKPVVEAPQPPKPTPAAAVPQKKGRGRPRKYPPTPKPLFKRPRGRPRINPLASRTVARNAAPSANPSVPKENYDITNMPYGDIEYLTKHILPLDNNEDHPSAVESNLMEPLVEINMEPERPENTELSCATAKSFLSHIGLLETSSMRKIGECTISVTTTSS